MASISIVVNERIVVRSTAALSAWEAVDFGPLPPDSGVKSNPWVRDGNNLVNVAIVAGRGSDVQLRQIEIYNRVNNSLTTIVEAPRGHYDAASKSWVLEGARQFDVARGTVRDVGTVRVGRDIRPEQFTLAKGDPDARTFSELQSAIADLRDAGRPTAELEGSLWHKLSGPLSALLMPILGSVAAFGLARSGQLFMRAVLGMALGFAYFVADNFSLAMGNLGAYPPVLAAWAPFFLFLLVGETLLFRTEE